MKNCNILLKAQSFVYDARAGEVAADGARDKLSNTHKSEEKRAINLQIYHWQCRTCIAQLRLIGTLCERRSLNSQMLATPTIMSAKVANRLRSVTAATNDI